jgi:hypothetical protein
VSPLVVIVASTLRRAVVLMENGKAPAKALRQVMNELIEYDEGHAGQRVDEKMLIDLSAERKPKVRAI